MRRYTLSSTERHKLQRMANHDLDLMAKRRSRKHEQDEARNQAGRQALRDALHSHAT